MKPEVYYDNKNDYIINSSVLVGIMLDKVTQGDYKDLANLKIAALDFISLNPDPLDEETDVTWVSAWKSIYNRLTKITQDIKSTGDYRLDWKRNEISKVAKALLAARRATPWVN